MKKASRKTRKRRDLPPHFYEDLVKRLCKMLDLDMKIEKKDDEDDNGNPWSSFTLRFNLKTFPEGGCLFEKKMKRYYDEQSSFHSFSLESVFKKCCRYDH